jgi:hypothetical protein
MELDASWYADDEWRGYVLHDRISDLLDRHVFVTWVAGLPHFADAAQHLDFAPGGEITLTPEPDNPYDPNAIGAWNGSGSIQVGHLPRVIVRNLADVATARVGRVTGEMMEGTERRGLWVVVAREPVELQIVAEEGQRPAMVVAWVRKSKDALRRSDDWKTLQTVDPMEQMRRMAEGLPAGDVTRPPSSGDPPSRSNGAALKGTARP